MRTASRVLGIVGGSIALITALFVIFGGVVFLTLFPSFENSEYYSDLEPDNDFYDEYNFNDEAKESSKLGGMMFLFMGSVIFISGVFGLIGGILVKNRNVLSGVFMLIGGAICLITIWAFLPAILLILGGIFALVNENKPPVTQPLVR